MSGEILNISGFQHKRNRTGIPVKSDICVDVEHLKATNASKKYRLLLAQGTDVLNHRLNDYRDDDYESIRTIVSMIMNDMSRMHEGFRITIFEQKPIFKIIKMIDGEELAISHTDNMVLANEIKKCEGPNTWIETSTLWNTIEIIEHE